MRRLRRVGIVAHEATKSGSAFDRPLLLADAHRHCADIFVALAR